MACNTSFIVLRPALNTPAVEELVQRICAQHDTHIIDRGLLPCDVGTAAASALSILDSEVALYSTEMNPASIVIDAAAESRLIDMFGITWADLIITGRVVSAGEVLESFNSAYAQDPGTLNEQWRSCKQKIWLKRGLALAYFEEEDMYVINGYYPAYEQGVNRPRVPEESLSAKWFVVEWQEERMTWEQFRYHVVGVEGNVGMATNPPPSSMNAEILTRWNELGVKFEPLADVCVDLIHASRGPLDAMVERCCWTRCEESHDPFGRLALLSGVSCDLLTAAAENPMVTVEDVSVPVIDILEDMQTSEAIQRLMWLGPYMDYPVSNTDKKAHVSFILLHPQASCASGRAAVAEVLNQFPALRICDSGVVSADAIKQGNLVDSHFGALAVNALSTTAVCDSFLSKEDRLTFEVAFGQTWDSALQSGRVLSATTAAHRFGEKYLTEINALWKEYGPAAGAAIKKIHLHSNKDCAGGDYALHPRSTTITYVYALDVYVVNADYLPIRQEFFSDGASASYFLVAWDESDAYSLSSKEYVERVIGSLGDTPAGGSSAGSGSIRRVLLDNQYNFNLPGKLASQYTGVSISSTPMEALYQFSVWSGIPMDSYSGIFPSWRTQAGMTCASLYRWLFDHHFGYSHARIHSSAASHVCTTNENLTQTSAWMHRLREEERIDWSESTSNPQDNCSVLLVWPTVNRDGDVESVVEQFLLRNKIRVTQRGSFGGGELERLGLLDRHFGITSHFAKRPTVQDMLSVASRSSRRVFFSIYGSHYEECVQQKKVRGAMEACEALGITGEKLGDEWKLSAAAKLVVDVCRGVQVAYVKSLDCFVLNGFFPCIHSALTAPTALLRWYVVAWEEGSLSWAEAMEHINRPRSGQSHTGSHQKGGGEKKDDDSPTLVAALERLRGPSVSPLLDHLSPLHFSLGPLEALRDRCVWTLPIGVSGPCNPAPLVAHNMGKEWKDGLEISDVQLAADPFAYRLLLNDVPLSVVRCCSLVDAARTHSGATKDELGTAALDAYGMACGEKFTSSIRALHGKDSSDVVQALRGITWRLRGCAHVARSVALLKPHAATQEAKSLALVSLNGAPSAVVCAWGDVGMREIVRDKLMERSYHALASNAMERDATQLVVTDEMCSAFKETFGISWETAVVLHLVINAHAAVERFGEFILGELWNGAQTTVCLSKDLYVAFIESEGLYVVNGFYPLLQAKLANGSRALWFDTMWDSATMDPEYFHECVIGSDDIYDANPESIRHQLLSEWLALGLEREPDEIDNGMDASSSAFGAIYQRRVWDHDGSMIDDPYVCALLLSGIRFSFMEHLLQSPWIVPSSTEAFTASLATLRPKGVVTDTTFQPGALDIMKIMQQDSLPSLASALRALQYSTQYKLSGLLPSKVNAVHDLDANPLSEAVDAQQLLSQLGQDVTVHTDPYAPCVTVTDRNHALVVLLPPLSGSLAATDAVRGLMLSHPALRIDAEGIVPGTAWRDRGAIERQLGRLVCNEAANLQPTSSECEAFRKAFEEDVAWDDAVVKTAAEAVVDWGVGADAVKELWYQPTTRRKYIGPGLYAALTDEHPTEYLINGFAADSSIPLNSNGSPYYFSVSWQEDAFDWSFFLECIVGSPNDPLMSAPVETSDDAGGTAETPYGTLQDVVQRCWGEFGLSGRPRGLSALLHASADPIQAVRERRLWLGTPILADPFARRALAAGISASTLLLATEGAVGFTDGDGMISPSLGLGRRNADQVARAYSRGAGSVPSWRRSMYLSSTAALEDFLSPIDSKSTESMSTTATIAGAQNIAFLVTKPNVCSPAAVNLVRSILSERGLSVLLEGSIPQHVALMCDASWSAVCKYATEPLEAIRLSKQEDAAVLHAFNKSWEDLRSAGQLVNTADLPYVLPGYSPQYLCKRWIASKRHVRVRENLEIVHLEEEALYFVNAFYPLQREHYSAVHASAPQQLHWFVISWSAELCSWQTFNNSIIGDEEPQAASTGSIRAELLAQWKELGLPFQPSRLFNGLHASKGPLHALRDRMAWLNLHTAEDPFGGLLLKHGISHATIRALTRDSEDAHAESTKSQLHQTEGCDAADVISMLAECQAHTQGIRTAHTPPASAEGSGAPTVFSPAHNNAQDGERTASEKAASAVVVVKRGAATQQVLHLIESVLAAHGIDIIGEKLLAESNAYPPQLSSVQYAALNDLAMGDVSAAQISVPACNQDAFLAAYGEMWEQVVKEGRVVNARQAMVSFKLTPSELLVKWMLSGSQLDPAQQRAAGSHQPWPNAIRLTYAAYVAPLPGCEKTYVINGFFPQLLRTMSIPVQPKEALPAYLVEWDESRLSWQQFCDNVVGAADPKLASPSSIRGVLERSWSDYGLARPIDVLRNAVQASSGPMEAYADRRLWFSEDMFSAWDPLEHELDMQGGNCQMLRFLARHAFPFCTTTPLNGSVGGDSLTVLGLFDVKDTHTLAELLTKLDNKHNDTNTDETAAAAAAAVGSECAKSYTIAANSIPSNQLSRTKQRLAGALTMEAVLNAVTEEQQRKLFRMYTRADGSAEGEDSISTAAFRADYDELEDFGQPMDHSTINRLFGPRDASPNNNSSTYTSSRLSYNAFVQALMERIKL